ASLVIHPEAVDGGVVPRGVRPLGLLRSSIGGTLMMSRPREERHGDPRDRDEVRRSHRCPFRFGVRSFVCFRSGGGVASALERGPTKSTPTLATEAETLARSSGQAAAEARISSSRSKPAAMPCSK